MRAYEATYDECGTDDCSQDDDTEHVVSLWLTDWWQWLAINGDLIGFGVARAWHRHVVPVFWSLVAMACTCGMHATSVLREKQNKSKQNKHCHDLSHAILLLWDNLQLVTLYLRTAPAFLAWSIFTLKPPYIDQLQH
jgi:hypothetical protein